MPSPPIASYQCGVRFEFLSHHIILKMLKMVHNAALNLLLIGTHMQRKIQVARVGIELIATHDGNCKQQGFLSLKQNLIATRINKQIDNKALVAAVIDLDSQTINKSCRYTPMCESITNKPKVVIQMFIGFLKICNHISLIAWDIFYSEGQVKKLWGPPYCFLWTFRVALLKKELTFKPKYFF